MSVADFWKAPSAGRAAWVVVDLIGASLPFVPSGSVRRAKQLIGVFNHAASPSNLQNATELATFSRLSKEAVPLATGEKNVRQAVGMANDGRVADTLAMAPGNRFIISESKAGHSPNIDHGVSQLTNTANHVKDNLLSRGGLISRLELVIHQGADLGNEYQVSNGQLLKFTSNTNTFEPVLINGIPVTVVEIPPPPVPSSVPPPPAPGSNGY
jgi:hypothetical protein